MTTFCDANIILRVLLDDTDHKFYSNIVAVLQNGVALLDIVMSEVIYCFASTTKRSLAYRNAVEYGELQIFNSNPKRYPAMHNPPAYWKRDMYVMFQKQWRCNLGEYNITFQSYDITKQALSIAQSTGYGWVDCMLLARHIIEGVAIASNDKDIVQYLDSEAKKLNLT